MNLNMHKMGPGIKKKPVVKKYGAESETIVEQVGMKGNSQIALESALMAKTGQDIESGTII